MKRLLLSFLLLAVLLSVPSFAENHTLMKVHVSKAVAIPGKILVPGDYIFRLDDASSFRIVSVVSADSNAVYGFIPVYPVRREGTTDESAIKAIGGDANSLSRIDSWYFPGQSNGYRFVYSKKDLAKAGALANGL